MDLNVLTKNDTPRGVPGGEPFGLFIELDREKNALEQLIERIEFLEDRLSSILISGVSRKVSTEEMDQKKEEDSISEIESIIRERIHTINAIQQKIDMVIQRLRL